MFSGRLKRQYKYSSIRSVDLDRYLGYNRSSQNSIFRLKPFITIAPMKLGCGSRSMTAQCDPSSIVTTFESRSRKDEVVNWSNCPESPSPHAFRYASFRVHSLKNASCFFSAGNNARILFSTEEKNLSEIF